MRTVPFHGLDYSTSSHGRGTRIFTWPVLLLAGCAGGVSPERPVDVPSGEAVTAVVAPAADAPAIEQQLQEENLYGRFFCDRAEFYVIPNPPDQIYDSPSRSLTLYLLDGKLLKKKYILLNDIHSALIRAHGNFSITTFDRKNNQIAKRKEVLKKTAEGLILNRALDNYELRWEKDRSIIIYRVMKVAGSQSYVYMEKDKSYESLFRELEKRCG